VELAIGAGSPVTFLATGQARDAEMAERIAAHRVQRPSEWDTLEEPYALEEALLSVDPARVVIIDCLSLWLANVLERGGDPDTTVDAAARAAAAASKRLALTIAVSNEVGLGIVPATPLGRAYRDLLGCVNRAWVDESVVAALVVAGRALPLFDVPALANRLATEDAR
jgi:adenosyl cobinamide kinase/adenosyl cobinamide phosphate guanylyltransferase